jgi:hypothetical protein
METVHLPGRRDRGCHVVHDGLPHAGCLPVGAELLQILVDGVNRLIHLVHAVLKTISSPFRYTKKNWYNVRECGYMSVQHR